jgi:hypothetical protein
MIARFIQYTFIYIFALGTFVYPPFSALMTPHGVKSPNYIIGTLLVILYFTVYALILFYGAFHPLRFRFTDEGIELYTLQGWRSYPWRDINQTVFRTNYRGYGPTVVLRYKGNESVSVSIYDFKKSRGLLNAMQERVAVPIVVPADTLAWMLDD